MRYAFGGFVLDTDARHLRRGAEHVHLSPKALDLLTILIAERPRAVAKQELYDRIWPATYVVEANLPVLIREVRAALGDKARRIIRTVHGTGYAFGVDAAESASSRHGDDRQCLHLIVVDRQQIRLNEGENLVGREPTAAVFLPSTSVSRRHAVITVNGTQAVVADLRSKNGTFVGDVPATSDLDLADGTLVRFGDVITRYRRHLADDVTESILSS